MQFGQELPKILHKMYGIMCKIAKKRSSRAKKHILISQQNYVNHQKK